MRVLVRLLFLPILLISGILTAQNSPMIQCISLDENDDVTLQWSQPQDTGADFNSYIIHYRAGGSGGFNVIFQSNDYNLLTTTIPGSFAGDAQFFIQQVFNGLADSSEVLDTVRPMILNIGSLGKRLLLGWNHLDLPSPDSVYNIYKQDTGGNWILRASTVYPVNLLVDSISSCQEEVTYRIEYRGRGGCTSVSNQVTRNVEDLLPPSRTNLVCASVDTATGNVLVEWTRSNSRDTYGYLVFYFEDFNRTDTVFGRDSTSLIYDKDDINGLIRPETLSVAPFDSCFDSLNNWYNQAADSLRFQTLFIDTIGYDRCAGTLGIKWAIPEGFALGVRNLAGFNVYRRINNGPSERLTTLAPTDTLFVDSGLVTGNKYNYVVTAVDGVFDKEAFSNQITFDLKKLNAPTFLYISSIKNDHSSGQNVVNFIADSLSETVQYGLWRSIYPDQKFIEVARFDETGAERYRAIDESDRSDQSAYYYQIAAYDLCGDVLGYTQVAKSMYITGDKNLRDLINTVYWDEYQGFDSAGSQVALYELYRVTSDGREDFLPIDQGLFEYVDDITTPEIINGNICYYVLALEDSGNVFGLAETSRSNMVCFNYPPKVFVPNAFSPDDDALNDVFKPYVNYVNPQNYLLEVFDRTGRRVYSSTDPLEGWDGSNQPSGVYAYRLWLRNARDEEVEQTGKVNLIR